MKAKIKVNEKIKIKMWKMNVKMKVEEKMTVKLKAQVKNENTKSN